ncbi:hypothetical protein [Rhodococcus sp. T7]|uniref:hypothetical protein n=1 Tax=Rhodococcus sp. T7 TaxID=627444 RepID=UPI00135B20C4|nr:hypothetical protein [Rhodococcus sp. T7]KAF0957348.1 hypothetical protein MLGJGCBP_09179 [Rhodococcus sp. T7]KAF0966732.1 hypothetical protein MLGJGCBP_00106 [Rhodococcus sp. T7]
MSDTQIEDRRLTIDLVALYDITRDYAIDLEYLLLEHEDAAADPTVSDRFHERRLAVKRERENLPLGTDLEARKGLIAAQDSWRGEIAALRAA